MTRCEHCGSRWTFGDRLRESFKFSLDRSMTCPYCQEKQYLTNRYRKKSALINFLMLLFMFVPVFFSAPWQVYVICLITAVSMGFFLQIHTFELSSTDAVDFWDQ